MNQTSIDPETLLARFGLTSFRPGQREVVDAVAEGRDVLCVMPTGGGKSLCFQLPALARSGTTIVVSPLIALMKDQVDTLRRRGISATLINSSLSAGEQEDAMQQMAAGALSLVYVAPERLRNSRFLDAVSHADVTLLAVDEAHCVSEWGHDFRPDYARLGHFRTRYLGGVQTIALTATATPHVRQDIQSLLGMKSPREFVTGFGRENLRFSVEHYKSDREKNEALTSYLKSQTGSGLIYASTRKRCEEIAEWLPSKLGKPIGVYHAGLEPTQRHAVQNQFMSGELSAIVATNAFGMGIDKADIRYVVHYNIPGSLEAYYQEAGRAGRDGKMSECRLLFAYSDRYVQEFFIENRYLSPETVSKVYRYLLSRQEDPIELTLEQVREAIGIKETAESVGTAETLLAKAGVLKRLDNSMNTAVIRIDSELPTLVDLLPRESKLRRKVLRAAEKIVGVHRGEDVYVRPQKLADLAGIDRDQLSRTLRELVRLKQFDYVPPFRGRAVHITQRDIPFDQLKIDFEELAKRKAAEYDKLEAVIEFARTARCRQRAVLEYFGDPNVTDCTKCDRCDPDAKSMPDRAGIVHAVGGSLKAATSLAATPASDYDQQAFDRGIRIVLSGIARMHGRFGKAMVAQMLGGSNNKKIQQWKLNRLSTYGMLGGLKQPQLCDLIDALISAGLVAQTEVDDRRPTVKLTADGEAVMRGRQPLPGGLRIPYPLAKRLAFVSADIEGGDVTAEAAVTPDPALAVQTEPLPPSRESSPAAMRAAVEPTQSDARPGVSTAAPAEEHRGAASDARSQPVLPQPVSAQPLSAQPVPAQAVPEPNRPLLHPEVADRLKRWRGRTSAALGIAAYRVLSNATIERIAAACPKTIDELQSIHGVGPATIEQFGYDLLTMIEEALGSDASSGGASSGGASSGGASSGGASSGGAAAPVPSPPFPPAQAPAPLTVSPAIEPAASAQPATQRPADVDAGDAYWTWRLFRDGYSWEQVCQIRCRDSVAVAADLAVAASTGHAVQPGWHNSAALKQLSSSTTAECGG